MKINVMKPVDFNGSTSFIFRKGMLLRQWQVDKLFSFGTRPEIYPEYLEYASSGQIRGLKNTPAIYNSRLFKMGCRKLYDIYPNGEIEKDFMLRLSNQEFRAAFFSGYVKHDSRGYYFDTSVEAQVELVKNA